MSFATDETSADDGQPVELYEFSYLAQTVRYTSADRDITLGPLVYTRANIVRGAIADSAELGKASLRLTAQPDFPPAQLFSVAPPSDVVNLVIKRAHYSDVLDVATIWVGRVLGVNWPSGSCEITCQSLYTSLKQPGLRRLYGRLCPHALYGTKCGAAQTDFKVEATVTGGASQTIQSAVFATYADGYFSGGKVEIEVSPGVIERRGIREHVGDSLVLTHAFTQAAGITAADVYPGCDHTLGTCDTKFDNRLRYGGFPNSVSKTPFGNSSPF